MDVYRKLASLLESEDARRRIAAAVVLGELKVKDAAVVARLQEMARDPLEPFATAALEALGAVGSLKALPVMLDALGRGGEVAQVAGRAIAALGPDALPDIRSRLADASPEVRARLSQLLPAVGGRLSFEMALEGMRGQVWEAVNRVALSVRQEMKTASAADRKVLRTQVEKFLDKKKTAEDGPALRGALKVLGYLELPDTAELLLGYTAAKHPAPVRAEAATALRFALGGGATARQLRRLIDLMEEGEPLVARAARDTLTVLPLGAAVADEFARLCRAPDNEVACWAIGRLAGLGKEVAAKTLVPVAGGADRLRAEAAVAALAGFGEDGPALLVQALCAATDEVGAHVVADALAPHCKRLSKRELGKLEAAGEKALAGSFALGRRVLEPLREAAPERWTELLSAQAAKLKKKEPAKAAAILDILARSSTATVEDRYAHALLLLKKSALDIHPRARQRDACLGELERLAASGFELGRALVKEKSVEDEALYYLGFHFAEVGTGAAADVGLSLLEHLVKKNPRNKLGKAARNKLQLLEAQ